MTDSPLKHGGIHFPSNAGGEHPSAAAILAMPGIAKGCTLLCAPEARYWYDTARRASPLVVWRSIPRQGKLPAQLGWEPNRVADECLNLWDEQPHGGDAEYLLPLNELSFEKENGGPFPGYARMAEYLAGLRLQLRRKLAQQYGLAIVRLLFPAWVPGDDLDRLSEWRSEAAAWDGICLHAYGAADEMRARYDAYRAAFPAQPILVGEWNANHTGASERESLLMWAGVARADPFFLGACFFIWETRNPGEEDLSIWGHPDRLALFSDPPTLAAPAPEPVPVPDYPALAYQTAIGYGLDRPDLFRAQIGVESIGYRTDVIECRVDSPAGARGIAQLMPVHWSEVDPCDPSAALGYAASLMAGHLAYWRGRGYAFPSDWALALASYNAGRQATIDGLAGEKPTWPFIETTDYVSRILALPIATAATLLRGQGAPMPVSLKLSDVLARGKSRIGDPYVWGGKAPPSTDCSGFAAWCYGGLVTSYTDAIYGETVRVDGRDIAPGDIVLYEYRDPDQPDTRFPHVALYLDDATVLDNRFGYGVGVHPQLDRSKAVRYYRRLAGVTVDTLEPPAPPTPPPAPVPHDDEAGLRSKLGYASHDVAAALQKEVDAITASLGALQAALNTLKGLEPK